MAVTISGDKITNIKVKSHTDDEIYMSDAESVISSIVSKQSTSVDTVSGATFSSRGIINATAAALEKAKN